jgi:predicted mannosyl-3-phosphoglycerate phosphatase (HAD superfamily)
MRIVVITDVDAMLTEPGPVPRQIEVTLNLLAAVQASVVLWSSRPRVELESIRGQLGLVTPFFVENGSALIVPPRYLQGGFGLPCGMSESGIVEFGCDGRDVRRMLIEAAAEAGVRLDAPVHAPR